MKFNELTLGKQKDAKRVGRGISAGGGKTAGRGTKGQGARKSPTRAGFEGGQMPLHMRLPKLRGFKSHRYKVESVYTGQLDQIKKAVIDSVSLFETGLINSQFSKVKLILNGDIKTKKEVRLQSASAGAITAVQKAGGSFKPVERLARPAKSDKKS